MQIDPWDYGRSTVIEHANRAAGNTVEGLLPWKRNKYAKAIT